jgi:tetratricopeptide (TPR) repeat protein
MIDTAREGIRPLTRAALMVVAAGEYLKTMLWPVSLSIDRILPSGGAAWPQYALSAVFAAGVPALWFSGKRRGAFWLLLFWTLYVPVSNLVIIEGRPFAEQRMYLPSAAFCAFIAWALTELPPAGSLAWRRVSLGFALALGLFWGVRGIYRNMDWKSEVVLWEKTVQASPSPRTYNNLAVSLLRENRYDEALRDASKSLSLDPAYVDAYNTLGAAYHSLGLYDQSISAFEKAVFFSDGRAYKSLMNLAALYSLKGRWKEALSSYQEVLRTAPWMDTAYYNMGLALAQQGRNDEAMRAFSEALALNPYNREAYLMLARILAAGGDKGGAAKVYADLLKIDPGNQQAAGYLLKYPPAH